MTTPTIDYHKRKNKELFKQFETNSYITLSHAQNYSPVYKRYFDLNETNYNSITLNHKWHLSKIDTSVNTSKCFKCVLSTAENTSTKTNNVFFKMAPLLDPYKYMSGKYEITDKLLSVPPFVATDSIHPKIMDHHNSSYVDGFFYYLSNRLLEQGFINGIEYYGSFLGIKNNFTFNVIDDIEYLATSDFFNKNKGVLFTIPDYSDLLNDENESVKRRQQPILISDETVLLDIESLDDELETLKPEMCDLLDLLEEVDIKPNTSKRASIKSDSSCSSRTSHTNSKDSVDFSSDDEDEDEDDDDEDKEPPLLDDNKDNNNDNNNDNKDEDESDYETATTDSLDDEDDDETLDATIMRFPVQMIAIEHCYNTFDKLIRSNNLTNDEWFSALMQIVMILLAYQHTYSMTHNDLHTNNVMFVPTDKKYLYYSFNKVYYKVPTFGRIFKIIDFGRAIYKFKDVLFCSDSFQLGGDAATQYNTEPFMNDRKPRLDPNHSFDLCRLACSLFDYIINNMSEIKTLDTREAHVKVIVDWCLDDNGINVLYKTSGAERYPEFKLYKMIARHVHRHTPQAQLDRPEFAKFAVQRKTIKKGEHIMAVDSYV